MTGKLLAAALAITTAFAVPALAQPAKTGGTTAAPPPAQAGPGPGMGDAWHRGVGSGWGHGMGYGMRPGWGHGMQAWQGAGQADPQERCIDRLARRAARLAYIETKLDLTTAQQPLWDKLQQAADKEARQERELCNDLESSAPHTLLDRVNHMERSLTVRLNGIKAAKPDLEALYKALSPEQQALLDHPFGQP